MKHHWVYFYVFVSSLSQLQVSTAWESVGSWLGSLSIAYPEPTTPGSQGSLSVEDERQMDALKGAVCIAAPPIPPRLHSEDKRKNPLQALEEWKAHLIPSLYCAGGEQKEVCPFHMVSRGDPYSKGCFGTMLQMGTIYIGRASHWAYKLLKVSVTWIWLQNNVEFFSKFEI